MVDVMPADQIVVIADNADFADHINAYAEFFMKLAPDCGVRVLVGFYAPAGGFNIRGLFKFIISFHFDKIEIIVIVYHDRPGNDPVMVNCRKRPFRVFQLQKPFSLFHDDFRLSRIPIDRNSVH